MLSSAGSGSPQLRPSFVLAAVALAALAASLLLAFALAAAPHWGTNGDHAPYAIVERRFTSPAAPPPPTVAVGNESSPPMLWALLAPPAFSVDAIALLGLAAVLIVRAEARRRRGPRR